MAERWLRELTEKCIRCCSFRTVQDLLASIRESDHHNQQPRCVLIYSLGGESIVAALDALLAAQGPF
jgi:hypothetical protein